MYAKTLSKSAVHDIYTTLAEPFLIWYVICKSSARSLYTTLAEPFLIWRKDRHEIFASSPFYLFDLYIKDVSLRADSCKAMPYFARFVGILFALRLQPGRPKQVDSARIILEPAFTIPPSFLI